MTENNSTVLWLVFFVPFCYWDFIYQKNSSKLLVVYLGKLKASQLSFVVNVDENQICVPTYCDSRYWSILIGSTCVLKQKLLTFNKMQLNSIMFDYIAA